MVSSTSTDDDSPPPSPPAIHNTNTDSLLPSYPEMILEAIASLEEDNGSSQAAIARRIEASRRGGELPPSHAALVAAHLSRMSAASDLIAVAGGKYMLPTRSSSPPPFAPAPLKRGRGRPPKSRAPVLANGPIGVGGPADSVPVVPKRRGRPPKPRDPQAPPKIPRPRGRPRKNPLEAGADGVPRSRPKVRPQFAEVGFV